MIPTATIVFREFLEIALILGVILAATRGMPGRYKFIGLGLGLGVVGSVILAFFTDAISEAVDGVGQEVFNAIIMFVAVGFLSWTVIWMKRHARDMSENLKKVGAEVVSGSKSGYVITMIIAVATLREGAEIALFTYGLTASGKFTLMSIITGGILGAIAGTAVGIMLYLGLLKAAKKYLFSVTSWLLIFLTAGMAAQGAKFLIAADVLPALAYKVWDTSAIISGSSMVGEVLGVLVGYTPNPSGMELIFYAGVLLIVGGMYRSVKKPQPQPQVAPAN